MKKILFAIALAIVATACHTNEGGNVQVGKIVINAATRSEVSEANTSSKSTLDMSLIPLESDLKVEISGNGTTQTWATYSEFEQAISEGLTFASAPHTITLSYGEKGTEGWSKPYFEGSTSVDVPKYGLTAEANIEVVLANSIVAIETTEQFDGYLSEAAFQINNIAWEANKGEMLFVNAGEATIVCTAKRPTGNSVTINQKVTLKPTHRHTLKFELSTAGNASVKVWFDDDIIATEEFEFELNENA